MWPSLKAMLHERVILISYTKKSCNVHHAVHHGSSPRVENRTRADPVAGRRQSRRLPMRMITLSRRTALWGAALATVALAGWPGGAAAESVLKIGVLGVMSGPAASWGLTNKYCAEATANMYNAKGGVDI